MRSTSGVSSGPRQNAVETVPAEITLTVNDVMILCLTGGFIQFYMPGCNRLVQIQDTRNVCKYSSGPMDPEGIMFCFYYDYPFIRIIMTTLQGVSSLAGGGCNYVTHYENSFSTQVMGT